MENVKPSRKTTKVGTVVSNGADKTVVVKVENVGMDPLYHRIVRRSSKFMAHDEENACKVGDRVQITECRPLSRRKRWRVTRVVTQAS
jgi:small subunit ribosomal protein S17